MTVREGGESFIRGRQKGPGLAGRNEVEVAHDKEEKVQGVTLGIHDVLVESVEGVSCSYSSDVKDVEVPENRRMRFLSNGDSEDSAWNDYFNINYSVTQHGLVDEDGHSTSVSVRVRGEVELKFLGEGVEVEEEVLLGAMNFL